METVDGIILILTCQKHINTRVKLFKLSKSEYNAYKVIYVIGDLFLNTDFSLDGTLLTIKCEDSYIHLLKKLGLSIKYLCSMFNIKEGILRCGDDLLFDEERLLKFIKDDCKFDFYGQAWDWCLNEKFSYINNKEALKKTKIDTFMCDYYYKHKNDFNNPQHNLSLINFTTLVDCSKRPDVTGPVGCIYYLSKKACDILITQLESIDFNIFHFDEFTQSYPYTIEDCAVTYIMYFNNVEFIHKAIFFDKPNAICKHTNQFKDD